MANLLTHLHDHPVWASVQISKFLAHPPENYSFDENTNLEGLLQRIPVDRITQYIQELDDEDEASGE